MGRFHFIIVGAVLVAALVSGDSLLSAAKGQRKAAPDVRTDFSAAKKITVVARKFDPQQLTPLAGATVKNLGGTHCIVGRVIGSINGEDWRKGTVIWIPVTDVFQLVEFDSLEQLKKALKFTK